MVVVDGQGIPLGGTLASASPSEVKLIEATLDQVKVPRGGRGRPRKRMPRLIADKGYDSDPLRKRLKQRGIDLICPHRRNRTKPKLQDARKLRRYRRRYKIERTFAWLGRNRRLARDYEGRAAVAAAFMHIATIQLLIRRAARP